MSQQQQQQGEVRTPIATTPDALARSLETIAVGAAGAIIRERGDDEDEEQQEEVVIVNSRRITPPRKAKKQIVPALSKWFRPMSSSVYNLLLNAANMRKDSEEAVAKSANEKKRRADLIESIQREKTDKRNKVIRLDHGDEKKDEDEHDAAKNPIEAATQFINQISSIQEEEDDDEPSMIRKYSRRPKNWVEIAKFGLTSSAKSAYREYHNSSGAFGQTLAPDKAISRIACWMKDVSAGKIPSDNNNRSSNVVRKFKKRATCYYCLLI